MSCFLIKNSNGLFLFKKLQFLVSAEQLLCSEHLSPRLLRTCLQKPFPEAGLLSDGQALSENEGLVHLPWGLFYQKIHFKNKSFKRTWKSEEHKHNFEREFMIQKSNLKHFNKLINEEDPNAWNCLAMDEMPIQLLSDKAIFFFLRLNSAFL